MTEANDPHLRRAGDPSDHAAERDALRGELGMGSSRAPLPVDLDRLAHMGPEAQPDQEASAEQLMDLVAHHKPPVPAHFVSGALAEHARHEREAHPTD
jgi:hypothetical protein